MKSIFLAGGCFWCTEAVFSMVKGVEKVIPGYIGGKIDNPNYQMVCNGNTGHAEAIKCIFNELIISLDEILNIFFLTHDPTQLNKQGNDVGTHYRSAIFCKDKEQFNEVEKFMRSIQNRYDDKIVTEVSLNDKFYNAETYHFNYYANNKNAPYCQIVIKPKIEKLKKILK